MVKVTAILNGTFWLLAVLFLLDGLTSFDIKSQAIKSFVYYGFLVGAPLTFLLNLIQFKKTARRIVSLLLALSGVLLICVLNPMSIAFSSGAWNTQTIWYKNKHSDSRRIEIQMQNVGALGYTHRRVEVQYLTPFFMIVIETVPDHIQPPGNEWRKVSKYVNEMGLKD